MTTRPGWRALAFGLAALVLSLGALALAAEPAARESGAPRLIGVLLVEFSIDSEEVKAFRQGLRDAGYAERRDVVIEWRSAKGNYARIPELAADLVQRKVDVLVADSTPGSQTVQRAADHWRRSAEYVDKILKGTKPGDLPVRQATKFEFVVNLTTPRPRGSPSPSLSC